MKVCKESSPKKSSASGNMSHENKVILAANAVQKRLSHTKGVIRYLALSAGLPSLLRATAWARSSREAEAERCWRSWVLNILRSASRPS